MCVYWHSTMIRRLAALAILILFETGTSGALQPVQALDAQSARMVADGVVADIIVGNTKSLFARMEAVFRAASSEDALPSVLRPMFAHGGKPLEAEFKAADSGLKIYLDGSKKPLIKVWYALRTTKSRKGTYFMFVEVVPDGGRLACTTFSIVAFAKDVPQHLK